jgi:hypothetical protein
VTVHRLAVRHVRNHFACARMPGWLALTVRQPPACRSRARWAGTTAPQGSSDGSLCPQKGHPLAHRSGHRLEVRYQPEPGIREELEALAAAERECCSFAVWTVSQEEDHVILRIAAKPGRPDHVSAVAALFGAD